MNEILIILACVPFYAANAFCDKLSSKKQNFATEILFFLYVNKKSVCRLISAFVGAFLFGYILEIFEDAACVYDKIR